jgi:hypothetical protein
MTQSSAAQPGREHAADRNAIRALHVNVPETGLTRRLGGLFP